MDAGGERLPAVGEGEGAGPALSDVEGPALSGVEGRGPQAERGRAQAAGDDRQTLHGRSLLDGRGDLCDYRNASRMQRVFLLSPAYCGGRRAAILLKPTSTSALAMRLRAGTLTLGEAFTFMSGLYFRGKIPFATFGRTARSLLRDASAPDTPAVSRCCASLRRWTCTREIRATWPLERDLLRLPAGSNPMSTSCCPAVWAGK